MTALYTVYEFTVEDLDVGVNLFSQKILDFKRILQLFNVSFWQVRNDELLLVKLTIHVGFFTLQLCDGLNRVLLLVALVKSSVHIFNFHVFQTHLCDIIIGHF